ncbi:Serine/threonine-protein kinase SBK2 [Fusarium oxysporum f. sp. albedinis]|nr:Serine/threonine-protein kinase SBK2 [Fusarium oxysporum f. sp. albedinis]
MFRLLLSQTPLSFPDNHRLPAGALRSTAGLLVQPTQSTGSYLLLQKGTTASSDEARPFTECSSQSRNGKGLH